MSIRSLVVILGLFNLFTACELHRNAPNPGSGMPCGISPATIFNFTLRDKDGMNLLKAPQPLHFYTLQDNQRVDLTSKWSIQPFTSDSAQLYVAAKTIYGFASANFYIETANGTVNQVDVTIGNNPKDAQCPNSYFYTRVLVNGQDETNSGAVKGAIPYYQLHL